MELKFQSRYIVTNDIKGIEMRIKSFLEQGFILQLCTVEARLVTLRNGAVLIGSTRAI